MNALILLKIIGPERTKCLLWPKTQQTLSTIWGKKNRRVGNVSRTSASTCQVSRTHGLAPSATGRNCPPGTTQGLLLTISVDKSHWTNVSSLKETTLTSSKDEKCLFPIQYTQILLTPIFTFSPCAFMGSNGVSSGMASTPPLLSCALGLHCSEIIQLTFGAVRPQLMFISAAKSPLANSWTDTSEVWAPASYWQPTSLPQTLWDSLF